MPSKLSFYKLPIFKTDEQFVIGWEGSIKDTHV